MARWVDGGAGEPGHRLGRCEEGSAHHDVVGRIHWQELGGQIQWGSVQAMGWGVTGALRLRDGVRVKPNVTDYSIAAAADAHNGNIAVEVPKMLDM